MKGGVQIYLVVLVASGVLFSLYPAADIRFTTYFYDVGRGGFYLKDNVIIRFIHEAVPVLVRVFVISVAGVFLFNCYRCYRGAVPLMPVLGLNGVITFYLLFTLMVGPGIIVNAIFKEHWDRARPSQITEFGGSKIFTPALAPSDQCESNCSFPSGHASVGFYLFTFAMLARRKKYEIIWTLAAIVAGTVVGMVRIIEGGHFLSDVIFSGLICYGVSRVSAAIILKREKLTAPL